jgi:hypothetical protein
MWGAQQQGAAWRKSARNSGPCGEPNNNSFTHVKVYQRESSSKGLIHERAVENLWAFLFFSLNLETSLNLSLNSEWYSHKIHRVKQWYSLVFSELFLWILIKRETLKKFEICYHRKKLSEKKYSSSVTLANVKCMVGLPICCWWPTTTLNTLVTFVPQGNPVVV